MVSADYSSKSRDEIRDEIVATCKDLFDNFDSLEPTKGEYKSDRYEFQGKAIDKDGLICQVQRGKFDGLTFEMIKEFRKDAVKRLNEMNPNAKLEDLPSVDGLTTRLLTMNIPVMFVSARSVIVSSYELE